MPWIFRHRGAPLWHTSPSMMIIEVCPWNTSSPRRGEGCRRTGNLEAHPVTQHLGNNISISFQLLSWKWSLHLKLVDCFERQFIFLKRCGQFHLTSDPQNGTRIWVLKGCHPLKSPAQDCVGGPRSSLLSCLFLFLLSSVSTLQASVHCSYLRSRISVVPSKDYTARSSNSWARHRCHFPVAFSAPANSRLLFQALGSGKGTHFSVHLHGLRCFALSVLVCQLLESVLLCGSFYQDPMKSQLTLFVSCPVLCPVASVVSDSLWLHGLQPTRLLCPWDSPGTNTAVGCHALLQGIFLILGSNPHLLCLLHWQEDSWPLSHRESSCFVP